MEKTGVCQRNLANCWIAEIEASVWRFLDSFQNKFCNIFLLKNVLCWTLSIKQQSQPKGSRCFAGMIKSESLILKAQCVCGEVGMLINTFGTTPPLSVSTEKKKTRWLHGAYMELPVRFFVALMSHCLQELATVYTKGTVDSVVQLCSNQPLRLFCCIILFIYKNCAAFLNNELPRAFNILIYSDKPHVALQ